jgi:peptide/nickel transport system permease protein
MRYLYRRIVFYLIALWASLTLNFFLPRLMPGSPIDYFAATHHNELENNPHLLDSLRVALGGSNEPLPLQYLHYLLNISHGDFGVSYSQYPLPVSGILAATIPWTLFLAGVSTVVAFFIGTLLGVVASWRRGGALDTILTPFTMFVYSFPPFFVAMLLLYFLGFIAGWFPLNHNYGDTVHPGFNLPFFGDALRHAAMPLLAIMLASVGGWLLGMRNVMINTLSEEFVTMAQAKGLTERRVMLTYAARNALLPQITSFAISLGYVVTGLVLIESVFTYQGVGFALFTAVQAHDYPLIQALFLFITVAMLCANFVADLLYTRLDPRVRTA